MPDTAPAVSASAEAPVASAPASSSDQVQSLPSLSETIARANAAGAKAAAEAKAQETAPVPDPPAPADIVADTAVPDPPAPATTAAAAVEPESKPDPMVALATRLEAMEKQNATLLEQLAKLAMVPAEVPKPEPEKPAAKPAEKRLTDSPFEAQARVYFGDDLPKPLMAEATDILSKRHGWQSELSAAEAASAAGDATARDRVTKAQSALARVTAQLERIEHDAAVSRALAASQKPAPQSWGVTAREEFVDGVLSIPAAERADWGDVAALPDHEIAAVMRAVPAGTNEEDYAKRASAALQAYAASKKQPPAAAAPAPAQPKAPAPPKNPAPLAPPKVETPTAGPAWPTDRVLSLHEIQQQSIARARGDRTN